MGAILLLKKHTWFKNKKKIACVRKETKKKMSQSILSNTYAIF